MSGYLSMTRPPGFPATVADAASLQRLFPGGGPNCCKEQSTEGYYCTVPAWEPHAYHENFARWGVWSGGNYSTSLLAEVSRCHKTWKNDKYVPGQVPSPPAPSKPTAVPAEPDWPGEEELLCRRATTADEGLLTIEQLDALDHEYLTGRKKRHG